MTTSDKPIPRRAARVVILDPQSRVLLVHFQPPPGTGFWALPGGGVEGEETNQQAAIRELREELHLTDITLSHCIWTREHTFPFRGVRYQQREAIFLTRIDAKQADNLTSSVERIDGVTEARWWTSEELRMTAELIAPSRLGDLLQDLADNGLPRTPVDVGV